MAKEECMGCRIRGVGVVGGGGSGVKLHIDWSLESAGATPSSGSLWISGRQVVGTCVADQRQRFARPFVRGVINLPVCGVTFRERSPHPPMTTHPPPDVRKEEKKHLLLSPIDALPAATYLITSSGSTGGNGS